MGWDGMDINMNVDMNMNMLLTKTCCRYLFSCEKKRKTRWQPLLRFTSMFVSSSSSTKT